MTEHQTTMTAKKKKKERMGTKSGQTDTERRTLRRNQRELLQCVTSTYGDGLEDATRSEVFETVRSENNELFSQVRFAREAVLDGENLQAIASRAARQADRLVAVARYDAMKFVRKLRSKCLGNEEEFQWSVLGVETGLCFNSVVSIGFLNGPMEYEVEGKKRTNAKRKARTVEEGEEEKPEELEKIEKAKDRASLAEKHLSQVRKVGALLYCGILYDYISINMFHSLLSYFCQSFLGRCKKVRETEGKADENMRSKKRFRGSVNLSKLLMNPNSFTESVENLFHFSFLVKKGEAGLGIEHDAQGGGPVTWETQMNGNLPASQTIVTLDMNSWKNLVEAYDVKKCYVPSRK